MSAYENKELTLESLPVASEMDMGGKAAASHGPFPRRGFLKGAIGIGMAAGLWTAGLLRGTPKAFANNPPWSTYPYLNPYGAGDCSGKGAFGCCCVGDLYVDNLTYCATCQDALTYPTTMWQQWHYQGTKGSAYLQDRPSNICPGNTDAWHHMPSPSNCGYCPTTQWRCHDGLKWTSTGVVGTICHGLAFCGSYSTPPVPSSC